MKKLMENIQKWPNFKRVLDPKLQMGVLTICLLVIILVSIGNSVQLNTVLLDSTEDYVEDVAYQLTNEINAKLESDLIAVQLVADSVQRLRTDVNGDQVVQDYLERKSAIMGMDSFIILEPDGTVSKSEFTVENPLEIAGVQDAFQGESNISHIGNEMLLFTVPIYFGDNIDKVLLGVRNQNTVQKMIQPKSFAGEGLSCIVSSWGDVIISPTDISPFMQLADIIDEGSDNHIKHQVEQLQDDLQKGNAGVLHFTSTNGTPIIMSYHSLHISDWVLLVMIPNDLVIAETSQYVVRTVVVTGLIALVIVLFLLVVSRFYYRYNKNLETIAYTDVLTGGLNNAAFQTRYRALAKTMQPNSYAVVLFNIKGFKLVNENFGVVAGDDTIKYVYQIMKENMSEHEFVARSESDFFFVCMKESKPEKIEARIEQLEKEINAFNAYAEIPYHLNFFQGVYLIDDPALEITIIQDRARAACQSQRLTGQTGCSFYSTALTQQMQIEQELDTLFDESIQNGDFKVYLQPKIYLNDNTLGGAEALVRWQHPKRGIISPADFIPVLEKNGKICTLDLYVFEGVCALQERWYQEGRKLFPISVNLSRQHFKNLNFLKQFSEIAGKYQIPPDMLEFELTESIFVDDQQLSLVKYGIQEMHNKGFLCSLDDFGSGFSSLGMLKAFDVDTLKLDRRFFDDMSSGKNQKIIACLTELADKLQVKTVAEGIETPDQLEYLRDVHCDMVQGYVFSRPLSIPDFELWEQQFTVADHTKDKMEVHP